MIKLLKFKISIFVFLLVLSSFSHHVNAQEVKDFKYIYSYAPNTLPTLSFGNNVKVAFNAEQKSYTISCANIEGNLQALVLKYISEFRLEADDSIYWLMKDKGGVEYILERNQGNENFKIASKSGYSVTNIVECTNEKYSD